jgi:hypothetical protein
MRRAPPRPEHRRPETLLLIRALACRSVAMSQFLSVICVRETSESSFRRMLLSEVSMMVLRARASAARQTWTCISDFDLRKSPWGQIVWHDLSSRLLAARLPYCGIGSPASSASMLAVVAAPIIGSFLSAAHFRYRQSGC